jgi:hypothetical protein
MVWFCERTAASAFTAAIISLDAPFDELPKRLLEANRWLPKSVRDNRALTFSVVGFAGRCPVAMQVSNVRGREEIPLRPKEPQVFVAGDVPSVTSEMKSRLKEILPSIRPASSLEVFSVRLAPREFDTKSHQMLKQAAASRQMQQTHDLTDPGGADASQPRQGPKVLDHPCG